MYRQGDILIRKARGIPTAAQPINTNVVAHGETGNTHRLDGPADSFTMLQVGPTLYIRARQEGVRLVHEEHGPIDLPQGDYEVVRQREYDEGVIRYVTD